jgi:hypothetical protein
MRIHKASYPFYAVVALIAALLVACCDDHHHHYVRVAFVDDYGAPGSVFVITGRGFDQDAVVWFGGVSAAVYVPDRRTIFGVVPDLAPGIVDVVVTNPASGASWGPLEFAVIARAVLSDIEGYAYFPYEDPWGNYPVYYDTGNELILVTLYDADDIYYAFPLREFITDTTGYYWFSGVSPDWYYLTAEAIECDLDWDIAYYYWTDTPDFELLPGELAIWDLYLEYDGWESGCPLAALYLHELAEHGARELESQPNLDQLHNIRLERFRREGRQRPLEFRLKSQSEQADSQPAAE